MKRDYYSLLGFLCTLVGAFVVLTVGGCAKTDQEKAAQNQYNLQHPVAVGVLDGKTLWKYTIINEDSREHYIYLLSKSNHVTSASFDGISLNFASQEGKTLKNKTMIILED